MGQNGALHSFAFVLRDDLFLELLDFPTTFPLVWGFLGDNLSDISRRAMFMGYTYRWVRARDGYLLDPDWFARVSPVRQQLLGGGADAMSHWGHRGQRRAAPDLARRPRTARPDDLEHPVTAS